MFTKFDPVIAPFTRHAENTDTHQYIRQHEREQNRRRPHDDAHKDEAENDDETNVSIDALLLFLENMAGRSAPQQEKTLSPDLQAPPPLAPTAKDSPSLYAANAYAHAAKTMPMPPHGESVEVQTSHTISQNPIIAELINELRSLKKAGVSDLHIERGDTFAESLFSAISNAKAPTSP